MVRRVANIFTIAFVLIIVVIVVALGFVARSFALLAVNDREMKGETCRILRAPSLFETKGLHFIRSLRDHHRDYITACARAMLAFLSLMPSMAFDSIRGP